MPKPTPRPNLIHQQLLGGLIETRLTSWFHKTIDPTHSAKQSAQSADGSAVKRTDDVIKTKTPARNELVNALAQNVSSENVERAAARWAVGNSSPAKSGEAAATRWTP